MPVSQTPRKLPLNKVFAVLSCRAAHNSMNKLKEISSESWAPPPTCIPVSRFELPPNSSSSEISRVALLIHGLTGSPEEMRPIAAQLAAHGYHCVAPLLSGHCTSLDDLSNTPLTSWQATILNELELIKTNSPTAQVVLIGLSLGALLSLWLLLERPHLIACTVLLSPPLRLRSPRDEVLHRFLSFLPECLLPLLGSRAKSRRPVGYLQYRHNAYPRHSIAAAERVLRLRDRLLSSLPSAFQSPGSAPRIIAAFDPQDHLVDAQWSERWISTHLPNAENLRLAGGQHELPIGHRSNELSEILTAKLGPSLASPGSK